MRGGAQYSVTSSAITRSVASHWPNHQDPSGVRRQGQSLAFTLTGGQAAEMSMQLSVTLEQNRVSGEQGRSRPDQTVMSGKGLPVKGKPLLAATPRHGRPDRRARRPESRTAASVTAGSSISPVASGSATRAGTSSIAASRSSSLSVRVALQPKYQSGSQDGAIISTPLSRSAVASWAGGSLSVTK